MGELSFKRYTLLDEVHPPAGHALRCALGYTLLDEVHPPRKGHVLRCALGYTLLDEVHPPRKGHVLRCALGYTNRASRDACPNGV
ncbi:MAG: hypothetical protein HFG84_12065 [Dorea sp.]|nr:hypothetical protein [Dorea sp.]